MCDVDDDGEEMQQELVELVQADTWNSQYLALKQQQIGLQRSAIPTFCDTLCLILAN